MTENFLKELDELVTQDCGTANVVGVNKIADIITKHYENMNLGWNIKRHKLDEKCGDMLAITNKPDANQYDVMILCHIDTVYSEGTCAKYPPYKDGDKYRGPGVSDMKSGCLAVIYALRQIKKEALDKLSICVCYTPDEEIGSPYSATKMSEYAKKAKCVFVAESARVNGNMINARKGNGKIQIEFFGKAAHAATGLQDGVSAVTELAHWVHEINKLVDYEKGTTASVGIVSGGEGINVVPAYAKAMVDQRFLTNDEGDRVLDHLTSLSKKPFLDGSKVEVKRLGTRPAFEINEGSDDLVAIVNEQAKSLGLSFEWITGGGASDGNLTAALGIPTLDGFGPCGAGFHNVEEEYMLISSIEPRIKLLQQTLEALANK